MHDDHEQCKKEEEGQALQEYTDEKVAENTVWLYNEEEEEEEDHNSYNSSSSSSSSYNNNNSSGFLGYQMQVG